MDTSFDIVREMEMNDRQGETQSSKYVVQSMREDIDKTEAYLNSKHTSGDTDSLGRDKPFFNIVTSHRNIWFRATDIDRKNIKIIATKLIHYVGSLVATLLLQKWMRKAAFGRFLNDWGLNLATHGSSIVKFIEKDGELHANVMDWNNMLVDSVDFDSNPKVEKLWLTPAQLKQNKNYDQDLVKKLLDSLTTRKIADGKKKDNKSDYILVYEIHQNAPLSFLTGKEEDEDTFVQQMAHLTSQEKKEKGKFDDYTLYSGKEAKDPYMLTHLIKKDGQTYAGGSIKNQFEHQWMVNHTEKQIKDQLDLASKIIFQTADPQFLGQNFLTDMQNGTVLIWNAQNNGSPLTMLNNKPDIAAMQANKVDWQNGGNMINGISESMLGLQAKSGTAWRQTQAELAEAHSLFELMTENKGLHIEDMMRQYIIPFNKKKMDTTEEITEILSEQQIKQIDSLYVPNEAIRRINRRNIDAVLNGEIPITGDAKLLATSEEEASLQNGLNATGNQRFIKPSEISTKTWKKVLKDLEWDLEIDITGEQKDNQAIMATYQTALQFLLGLQGRQMTSEERTIFGKLLSKTGDVSPLEINQSKSPVALPVGGEVGAGEELKIIQ